MYKTTMKCLVLSVNIEINRSSVLRVFSLFFFPERMKYLGVNIETHFRITKLPNQAYPSMLLAVERFSSIS